MSCTKLIEDGKPIRTNFKVEIDLGNEGVAKRTAKWLRDNLEDLEAKTCAYCWARDIVDIIENK